MISKKINPTITKGVARVPVIMQMEEVECGATSLAMVMAYYGRNIDSVDAAYAYMANERYDGAMVKLGEEYKKLIQRGILSARNMPEWPQDGYLNVLVAPKYLERFNKNTKEAAAVRRLQEYRERVID